MGRAVEFRGRGRKIPTLKNRGWGTRAGSDKSGNEDSMDEQREHAGSLVVVS